MENEKIKKFLNQKFILVNIVISLIQAALYAIRGFQSEFSIGILVVTGMNILFIPLALIFKKKGFSVFYLCYSVLLVFVIAFEETYLFNNYSALFMICLAIMIQPKFKIWGIVLYYTAVCTSFLFNSEPLIHFMIHLVRSVWYIQVVSYVLDSKFDRKRLILYEDEIKILEQLSSGKMYQKEVEGFSENTIYRKLKAARERNGNLTREQLVNLYREEMAKKNEH